MSKYFDVASGNESDHFGWINWIIFVFKHLHNTSLSNVHIHPSTRSDCTLLRLQPTYTDIHTCIRIVSCISVLVDRIIRSISLTFSNANAIHTESLGRIIKRGISNASSIGHEHWEKHSILFFWIWFWKFLILVRISNWTNISTSKFHVLINNLVWILPCSNL